jgi:hypothetical protein
MRKNDKGENYSCADDDDDEVSFADGSSTIATRTYHCFEDSFSMKSHDATIKSKQESRKSSQSTSYRSKVTDGSYKTAAYCEQIPEDKDLPIDATNKLQKDLQTLHLKSADDHGILQSATNESSQIQPFHFPSPSAPLNLLPPSPKLELTSSIVLPASLMQPPFSIPHRGSSSSTKTSRTSKRDSEHSRKYKSGELLIGKNEDAKSAPQLHVARYVDSTSSERSRKSSISKNSGKKSRKTARTSYSNPGIGVPPSSISVRSSTPHHSVLNRPEDESVSHHPQRSQHKSDTAKQQREMTSIKSCGTSTLIHRVDEIIDGASSDMRGVDAHFATVCNSDDKEKNGF